MSSSLPVLWICGAPGAGKSVTAWSLCDKVAGEGVAVAYIDIDQLGMLYPESDADLERFRLKTEALNALIPSYLASGAQALIVSGIVDPDSPADAALQYPTARRMFCLLDMAEATLRERILDRGWDPEDADEALAEAAALAKRRIRRCLGRHHRGEHRGAGRTRSPAAVHARLSRSRRRNDHHPFDGQGCSRRTHWPASGRDVDCGLGACWGWPTWPPSTNSSPVTVPRDSSSVLI